MKNKIAAILILGSFALIVPAVSLPIFELSLSAEFQSKLANFSTQVLHEKRSILGTSVELFEKERYLVAGLIMTFCVVVPALKAMMILVVLLRKNWIHRERLLKFAQAIGKWSMADVFTISILLAYLATRNSIDYEKQVLSLFGMQLEIATKATLTSSLGPGFYYFTAYCLVSILAFQLVDLRTERPAG